MKVTVRDSETLKSIEPARLAAYLQAKGWYEARPFLNNATIWLLKGDEADSEEILLPKTTSLGDYAARISDALKILEIVEQRSQLDILSDLLTRASNIEIPGMVVSVQQLDSAIAVTLMGVVLAKLHQITIELTEAEYTLALKAYQERLPVICRGDLIKEGNFFVLKNPCNFRLDNEVINLSRESIISG